MFKIVMAFKNGGSLYLHTGYTSISIKMRSTDYLVLEPSITERQFYKATLECKVKKHGIQTTFLRV